MFILLVFDFYSVKNYLFSLRDSVIALLYKLYEYVSGHDVISMFFYGLRGTFFWWRISILRLRKVLTWFLRKQWATTLPPPAERV